MCSRTKNLLLIKLLRNNILVIQKQNIGKQEFQKEMGKGSGAGICYILTLNSFHATINSHHNTELQRKKQKEGDEKKMRII